jgi:hypothetical protein
VLYACQLAKDNGAELIIFNVAVLDESKAIDKRQLERHKKQLADFVAEKVGNAA